MAKGVPVVGGKNSGGVPWLLNHGAAGLLVDIGSPEAVANGMIELVAKEELYKGLAQRAYQRAAESFTLDAVVRQYLDVYQSVRRPSPV
jgi:glycosyltransferase involved in cell wall biosynthesis